MIVRHANKESEGFTERRADLGEGGLTEESEETLLGESETKQKNWLLCFFCPHFILNSY